MDIPGIVWVVGGVATLAVGAICILLVLRSRRVNLTRAESPDQKPEWVRTTPPLETVAATRADGEGFTLYDHDPGEQVAAPFAEQIEDILSAYLSTDPTLATVDIDVGTAPDGGLEVWVDGKRYTDINRLPSERLRQIFRQAIERWEQAQEG
ncbi:MAG: hypothetical protein SXV54_08810 [Chloroflexota bacterium]|nr:hypothetical protein [Chloroflexota bacterium]